MSKNHNKNDRPFLSSYRTSTTDGNTRNQNSQCMAYGSAKHEWQLKTEKLLKAKSITSKQVPYVQRQ